MAVPDTVERDIPNNLPDPVDVEDAPLPDTYEDAKRHLRRCEEVDECKDWGDKAQALASYAKQAEDDELYRMARRIQGRAVRRMGQLMERFQNERLRTDLLTESNHGQSDGGEPRTQREAAEQAGISPHQERQARNVAEVPEEEFEEAVESDDPPSVTELAEKGKGGDDLTSEKPEGFKAATSLLGRFRRLAEFCDKNDASVVAEAMEGHEIDEFMENLDAVDEWIQSFVSNLEQ